MTKFFNKFKKPCFWPIFGQFSPFFGQKDFFKKNPTLSRKARHGPLTPCWVSEKTIEPIPRKLPDRQKDGWKDGRMDGQTQFYRTLPATAGGPKNPFLAHFGSIFSIFGAQKIFLESPALSRTTSYRFLAPCQNLEKVNDNSKKTPG